MCCFSSNVKVNDTRIFARPGEAGHQYLVYAMSLESEEEGAMVLPLPVPPRTPEDGVKFINLEGYKGFFDDLKKAFPRPRTGNATGSSKAETSAAPLVVQQVGAYEASFVPTVKDFDRLDQRFRLPTGTWEKLEAYADHGFAVFKLKSGKQDVHPMAFSFPNREPRTLFFPTVHIHDGEVHAKAHFDHTLYCQPGSLSLRGLLHWRESPAPVSKTSDIAKSRGTLDGERHLYTKGIEGKLKNEDTVLTEKA